MAIITLSTPNKLIKLIFGKLTVLRNKQSTHMIHERLGLIIQALSLQVVNALVKIVLDCQV